jgi:hypothetical protein
LVSKEKYFYQIYKNLKTGALVLKLPIISLLVTGSDQLGDLLASLSIG